MIWSSLSKEAREGDWEQGTCESDDWSSNERKQGASRRTEGSSLFSCSSFQTSPIPPRCVFSFFFWLINSSCSDFSCSLQLGKESNESKDPVRLVSSFSAFSQLSDPDPSLI